MVTNGFHLLTFSSWKSQFDDGSLTVIVEAFKER